MPRGVRCVQDWRKDDGAGAIRAAAALEACPTSLSWIFDVPLLVFETRVSKRTGSDLMRTVGRLWPSLSESNAVSSRRWRQPLREKPNRPTE